MTRLKEPKEDGDVWFAEDVSNYMGYYVGFESHSLAASGTSNTLDTSGIANRQALLLKNTGEGDLYFTFAATATVASGFKLEEGGSIMLKNVCFDNVSVITNGGTGVLSIGVFTSNYPGYKTNFEIKKLSVTSASSNVSFSDVNSAKDIIIINTGGYECYFNLGATATTSNFKLGNREFFFINNKADKVSGIAETGVSTTLDVLGVW